MKTWIQYSTLFSLLIALSACGSPRHEQPLIEDKSTENQTLEKVLETPELIVYNDIKKYVLEPSCVECHQEGRSVIAGVDVSQFEKLFGGQGVRKVVTPFSPEKSLLYETLTIPSGSRHMPPLNKPQLSKEQILLVYQWIKKGAKQTPQQVVEIPKTLNETLKPYFDAPQTIDYKAVKEHVFDVSCAQCHSTEIADGNSYAILYGQNMTTYQDLFSNYGLVPNLIEDKWVPNGSGGRKRVRGSRIYKSMAIHQTMPPAKDGYQPADSLRIKLLRLWILNCAIEDFAAVDEDDLEAKADKNGKIRNCLAEED